jgi:hypothetical protein
LLINGVADEALKSTLHDLALEGVHLSVPPMVAAHAITAPRIAIMHTWLATLTEGWWRYAFDTAGVPYDYISTQTVAKQEDLHAKYDVIVFAPVSRLRRRTSSTACRSGATQCPGRKRNSRRTWSSTRRTTFAPGSATTASRT